MNVFTLEDEEAIIKFLVKQGKGAFSKYYELVIAILLKKFLEKKWKTKCVLGFDIKDSYSRKLPSKGFIAPDQIQEILKKGIEKDTPVDVFIYEKSTIYKKQSGRLFQLKRFGVNLEKCNTKNFIEFLRTEIPHKYAKTNATLFIVFSNCGKTIDFKNVVKELSSLVPREYPFVAIMFTISLGRKIYICELWPKEGQCEYDIEDLL